MGWAFVAGLAGSLANTVAIRLVHLTPIPPGTGGLAKMTLAAINGLLGWAGFASRAPSALGPVGQEVFHTAIGVTMALIYAVLFYRLLPGPGWLRGLIYCQIPWAFRHSSYFLGWGLEHWDLRFRLGRHSLRLASMRFSV